jgi:bacteriorhodopsin
MDLENIFYSIYIVAMAIGAAYFILLSRNPQGVPKYEYAVAAFIPIWSGLAYLSMTLPHGPLEQGKVEVAGQIAHYARYLDWIVTTPLLLLALAWTAMHYMSKDWTLIGSLMGTQVIVVVSGFIADLSEVSWVRFLWYSIGVVAFLGVLWMIWGPLRSKTRDEPALARFFDRLTAYFTVLWICYPIVWILGPSGFRIIGQTFETFLFCLIPFFSKVGFSFLDLHGLRGLRASGLEQGVNQAVG